MAYTDLLQEVKDKLRVTWTEEDARILSLIESAQADLNGLCGKKLNYEVSGKAKILMLEHVFYSWNNALHDFRNHYANELMEIILLAATGDILCTD